MAFIVFRQANINCLNLARYLSILAIDTHDHSLEAMTQAILVLLLLCFIFNGQIEAVECYLKNAEPYPAGVVCNPDSLPSLCCVAGWICSSNGLCTPPGSINDFQQYRRGSCTDPNWNTTACFGGCNDCM